MNSLTSTSFTAFIGIDWADTIHDICLQASNNDKREFAVIPHQVDRIEQWAHAVHERIGGTIAIAVELTKGPIVYALQKYNFPTDAELALDLIMRHPERFKPLKPQSVAMRTFAAMVEQRRALTDDKTRFTNRLGDTLKQYYPQALEWFDHRDTVLFLRFRHTLANPNARKESPQVCAGSLFQGA